MSLENRVSKLEREHFHMMSVLATQRETMTRALQQVQTTLLEQDVMLRSHLTNVFEGLKEVGERQEQQEAWNAQIEARVQRLEQQPPPAA